MPSFELFLLSSELLSRRYAVKLPFVLRYSIPVSGRILRENRFHAWYEDNWRTNGRTIVISSEPVITDQLGRISKEKLSLDVVFRAP